MAEPIDTLPLPDYLPPKLAKYIEDDCRKAHLAKILEGECDVLVFDLTRDVMCGMLDFGDHRLIADPMSLKDHLWNGDRPSREDLDAILPAHKRRTIEDADYLDLWSYAFDSFVAAMAPFRMLILNRVYYADHIASHEAKKYLEGDDVRRDNLWLEAAYDYVEAHHPGIVINKVDRRLILTAEDVPYDGPHPSHLLPETMALYADGIANAVAGRPGHRHDAFVRVAFQRIRTREDKWREFEGYVKDAERVRDETIAALDEQSRDFDAAREEARRLGDRVAQLQAERDHGAVEVDEARRDRDSARLEAERLRDEIESFRHEFAESRSWSEATHRELEAAQEEIKMLKAAAAKSDDATKNCNVVSESTERSSAYADHSGAAHAAATAGE